MTLSKKIKIIVRKYLLNPVYVVAVYFLFTLSLFIYTNPFEKFFNPSFFLLFPVFIFIRLMDDLCDFYIDKLNDKAVFSRKCLLTLSPAVSIIIIFAACFTNRFYFILLLGFISLIYLMKLDFLKPFVVPFTFLIVLTEFSFHFSNIIFLTISFGVSILFSLIKKKDDYTLDEIGGKAYNLYKLKIKNTPSYFPIKACYLNPPDKEKIQLIVNSFCKKNKLYAVRSSAIDEDSAENSFAGVHETFLNVKKCDVVEKVLTVAESARSETAIKYRKDKNLPVDDIKISVLLQEMVDADYAGVLNTINPVTNDFSQTVVSVTEGLGDKIVDGTVDGTTYYIDSKKIDVKGPEILNRKILNKLIALANELRTKTDRFQDCEFAVKNNKVYFLQSRAITTYDVNPHEMTLLIDNSNLIESYYGMTSPLTHSFAHEIYTKVYTATCNLGKINHKTMEALKPALENMLYSYEGKLYYNLNSWYKVTSIFPSKKSTTYMESMMGVKSENKDFKKIKLGLLDLLKIGIIVLKKFRRIDELSDVFVHNFNQIVNPYYGKNLDALSLSELTALYEEIDSKIIREFTTPILNDLGVMMNFGRLKEKIKKYDNADELLAFCVNNNGNVESAKNASEFIRIVDFIKNNDEIRRDFEKLDNNQLFQKYYENENQLSVMIKKYIYAYGPRVMNELKLETVTMIEEPSMIFDLLKDGLKNQNSGGQRQTELIIPSEIKNLSEKTRHFIQNRERLRLRRTYVFSVIRNIFLSCGKNLVKQGKLNSERDVFYLKKNEIFYEADKLDLKKIVEERKNQEKIDSEKEYYSRIAFFGDRVIPITFVNPKGLCGLPSGNGIVTGEVCVMENKDSTFIPGSIIVTKRTDPGWISLFPLASGLIVEHGSMLSHSFVVAREMNLPCVVGVEGITQLLKNGDRVTLDASKGEIKIETV